MPKIWKQIPSQPLFEASSTGLIRRIATQKVRYFVVGKTGYLYVSLYKNHRNYPFLAHRMVAEAFLGPCPDGMQVRHLDGDPSNNHYKNLKYGTPKENGEDKVKHKRSLRGQSNGNSKASDANVRRMRKIYAQGRLDQRAIARKFGISQAQVNNILLMKQRQNDAFNSARMIQSRR